MSPASKTVSSKRRLSEVARHLIVPPGIVTTAWPRIEAQCAEMGVRFDEWQRGVGQVAFGKRKDGKYAASVGGVVLSIPRQVGKTFFVGMVAIAMCVLFPNTTVLWTAHRTRTATKTFTTMQGYVRRKRIAPHLAPTRTEGIRTGSGEQEIQFRNGSIIMFGARADGFGRGFDKVDVEVFDEAQIIEEKALEDMVPATNQSEHPAGALLFFMGTPPRPVDAHRGDDFRNRRNKALDGKSKDTFYVEISADDAADPDDPAQWAKANPSYPHRTPLESMQRMRENLQDDDSFRREALGVWDPAETPEVIPAVFWSAIEDQASMPFDRVTVGVDVAPGRKVASVSIAARRADGLWHVQLDEQLTGTDWVGPYVERLAQKNKLHAVVLDVISGLVETRNGRNFLAGTNVQITAAKSDGLDMAVACGQFYDAVMEKKVRHVGQPQLNVALSVARQRNVGSAWAWNRKDLNSDITPLVSATLALWGARKDNVTRPTRRRTDERTAVIL